MSACPQCGGHESYEITDVRQADNQSSNGTYPLTLVAVWRLTGEKGVLGGRRERAEVRLSARICTTCLFTVLHARDKDVLARLASDPQSGVRLVRN